MRSLSDQFLLLLPMLMALVLLAFFATPMRANGWPLAPNVGAVMTVAVVAIYPPAWPRWFAFIVGLAQDVMFGTPLGAQALILLLLATATHIQSHRGAFQQFRLRWLEAAVMLILAHLLLWVIIHFVAGDAPPLRMLIRAAIINALWYPLFYGAINRWALLLPPMK